MTPPEPKWPDMTSAERRAVLDSLVVLVTTLGGACSTAYRVAAEFAYGLEELAGEPNSRRWSA